MPGVTPPTFNTEHLAGLTNKPMAESVSVRSLNLACNSGGSMANSMMSSAYKRKCGRAMTSFHLGYWSDHLA